MATERRNKTKSQRTQLAKQHFGDKHVLHGRVLRKGQNKGQILAGEKGNNEQGSTANMFR